MSKQFKSLICRLKRKGTIVYICNMCDMEIRMYHIGSYDKDSECEYFYHYRYCKGYGFFLRPNGVAEVVNYSNKIENAFIWGLDKEQVRRNVNKYLTEFKKDKLKQFDDKQKSFTSFDWNEFLMYYINRNIGTLFRKYIKRVNK